MVYQQDEIIARSSQRLKKHELLTVISSLLQVVSMVVVGNSRNDQIIPKMCVIVEQS